jgi:hypothetical protein
MNRRCIRSTASYKAESGKLSAEKELIGTMQGSEGGAQTARSGKAREQGSSGALVAGTHKPSGIGRFQSSHCL